MGGGVCVGVCVCVCGCVCVCVLEGLAVWVAWPADVSVSVSVCVRVLRHWRCRGVDL